MWTRYDVKQSAQMSLIGCPEYSAPLQKGHHMLFQLYPARHIFGVFTHAGRYF
jgi:hypothetical protein